jgi:hypothetical protein
MQLANRKQNRPPSVEAIVEMGVLAFLVKHIVILTQWCITLSPTGTMSVPISVQCSCFLSISALASNMSRLRSMNSAVLVILTVFVSYVVAVNNGLARVPQMGWVSSFMIVKTPRDGDHIFRYGKGAAC